MCVINLIYKKKVFLVENSKSIPSQCKNRGKKFIKTYPIDILDKRKVSIRRQYKTIRRPFVLPSLPPSLPIPIPLCGDRALDRVMAGRRDGLLTRTHGSPSRGSRIAAAVAVGIVLGCVCAFLYPDGLFRSFSRGQDSATGSFQASLVLLLSLLIVLRVQNGIFALKPSRRSISLTDLKLSSSLFISIFFFPIFIRSSLFLYL